jgi:hypothetical protein
VTVFTACACGHGDEGDRLVLNAQNIASGFLAAARIAEDVIGARQITHGVIAAGRVMSATITGRKD